MNCELPNNMTNDFNGVVGVSRGFESDAAATEGREGGVGEHQHPQHASTRVHSAQHVECVWSGSVDGNGHEGGIRCCEEAMVGRKGGRDGVVVIVEPDTEDCDADATRQPSVVLSDHRFGRSLCAGGEGGYV